MLRWPAGRAVIDCISDKVQTFLEFTNAGIDLVLGHLSSGRSLSVVAPNVTAEVRAKAAGATVVYLKALSIIYFFSLVINVLFHYGILQVRGIRTFPNLHILKHVYFRQGDWSRVMDDPGDVCVRAHQRGVQHLYGPVGGAATN